MMGFNHYSSYASGWGEHKLIFLMAGHNQYEMVGNNNGPLFVIALFFKSAAAEGGTISLAQPPHSVRARTQRVASEHETKSFAMALRGPYTTWKAL